MTQLLPGQDFNNNREKYIINVHRCTDEIVLDGVLDEQTWIQADIATDFFRVLPIDTGLADSQTEVRMAYNESELFMSILCHDTVAGKRPAESLRRDFVFGKNDNFLAFIDTYNDQTNGFSFGISASGAQWDGLQANGGFVALDWDCKWKSEIKNDEEKWVAEFAIPFRSIRYQEGVREWGINFSRLDLKTNEKSSWAPIPRQFQTANLAFTGTAVFDDAPPKLGTRFSLIPYVSGRTSSNAELNEKASYSADAGIDAKVTLSTSLNLDITVNPDFSQVEVDRQVTNLDRFELFFPERRQFFLENSDLFASLGTESIRPFFSRRIGLQNPVQAGARLSGKIGDQWRLGLMNMQTGMSGDIAASNFTVAALQKKILSRSNIGAFFVNKINTGDLDPDHFNRVAGLEFNLASKDSRWVGKAFYHHSFSPENDRDATASLALTYNTQRWLVTLDQAYVGENYSAETGFIRRQNFYEIKPVVGYKFYPAESKIANHGPTAKLDLFFDLDGLLTDRVFNLDYGFQWLSRSQFSFGFSNDYVRLRAPFDPTNTGDTPLMEGEEFSWSNLQAEYTSNARRLFNYSFAALYGGYFNGDRFGIEGECNYRVQPYGSLGLISAFNRLLLPAPYGNLNLFLLGPKLDITFTDKLFLTTFVQYNSQIENLNVNVRFQWRYAPVSDLFVVYTDNSDTRDFLNKNRALVLKLSYYFN
ncbi:MAG: carbohydrate binding family 9 domain-containing protein [Saprospiraceae bacterium]|nr:carbohydrate binding family 9 domain-containing protein [Saprospiraceae bacterium]